MCLLARAGDISPSGAEVQRFARFLTFPTVSNASAAIHISPDREEHFEAALGFLKEQFSLVWEHLTVERVRHTHTHTHACGLTSTGLQITMWLCCVICTQVGAGSYSLLIT